MATYYLRGGSWTYNSTINAFSTTPSGSPISVLPTSSDDVIFDSATPFFVSIYGSPNCKTFTANGWVGVILGNTLSQGSTPVNGILPTVVGGLNVYGNVTMSAQSCITAPFTLVIRANSNLTSNGTIFPNVTITDGATVTLQDSLVCYNNGTLLLESGTLNANNQSVAVGKFMTPKTNNSRTLNMGAGTWNLLGSGPIIDTADHVWNDQSTSTFFTLNSGTSKMRFIPGSAFVLKTDITDTYTGNISLVYGGEYSQKFNINETGYVVIDNEVMSFSSISLNGNTQLPSVITIDARGLKGTKKQPHVALSPVIVLSGPPAKHWNTKDAYPSTHEFILTPNNYTTAQYVDSGYNANTGGSSSISPALVTSGNYFIGTSGNAQITECYYRVFSNSSYFRITISQLAYDPKKFALAAVLCGSKVVYSDNAVYSYQGGIASWTWPSNNSVLFPLSANYWGGVANTLYLRFSYSPYLIIQSNPGNMPNTYNTSGSVLIDGEVIRYNSTSTTLPYKFYGLQRGTIYGSTAQGHADNTPVLPATSRSIFTGNKAFNKVEFWSSEQYVITRIYDAFNAAQVSNNRLGIQNLIFDATKTHSITSYQLQGTNTQPIYVSGLPDTITSSFSGSGTTSYLADYQSSSAALQVGDQYFSGQVDMFWGDKSLSTPTFVINVGLGSTMSSLVAEPRKWTKSAGSDIFDSQVASSTVYSTGCYATAVGPTNSKVAFGLNSDPNTNYNYTSIDYCFLLMNNNWYIYENGGSAITSGPHTSALDVFTIVHDGSSVKYYVNGVLKRTVTRGTGNLYFDSSFSTPGSYLDQIDFRPYSEWKSKIKVVLDADIANFYNSVAGTFVKILFSDNINYLTGSVASWYLVYESGGYTRWGLVVELNCITVGKTATNNLWQEANGQIFFNSFKSSSAPYGNLVAVSFPEGTGIPFLKLVGKTVKINKNDVSTDYIQGNVVYVSGTLLYLRPLYATYSQLANSTQLSDWYLDLMATSKTSVPLTIPQSFSAFDTPQTGGFNATVRVASPVEFAYDYFSTMINNAVSTGAKYRITGIVGRSATDYLDGTLTTFESEYDIDGNYTGYAIYTFNIISSNFSRSLSSPPNADIITANFYAIPNSQNTRFWQLTSGKLTYRIQNDYNVLYEESVSNSPYQRSVTLYSVPYPSTGATIRPDPDSYISFNFNLPRDTQDTYKGGPYNSLGLGHTLIVLDPTADDADVVKSVSTYDTSQFNANYNTATDALATAISLISTGSIILLVSRGGSAVNAYLRTQLISCGGDANPSPFPTWSSSPSVVFSHCFIGRKGSAPGTAIEDIAYSNAAGRQVATVNAYFDSSGVILKYPSPAKQGLYCKIQTSNFNYNNNSGPSYILINGVAAYHSDYFGFSRGHIVVITDQYGRIITKERYDTWGYVANGLYLPDGTSDNAVPRMVTVLNNAPIGAYCFITSFDAVGFSSDLITALRSYGSGITMSSLTNGIVNRYNYGLIGKKGSAPGTAKEVLNFDSTQLYNLELFVEPDNSVLPFPNPRRSDLLDFG